MTDASARDSVPTKLLAPEAGVTKTRERSTSTGLPSRPVRASSKSVRPMTSATSARPSAATPPALSAPGGSIRDRQRLVGRAVRATLWFLGSEISSASSISNRGVATAGARRPRFVPTLSSARVISTATSPFRRSQRTRCGRRGRHHDLTVLGEPDVGGLQVSLVGLSRRGVRISSARSRSRAGQGLRLPVSCVRLALRSTDT